RTAPRTGAMSEEASERVERMRFSLLSCRLVGFQVSLTEAAPHTDAAVHSKVHGRLCGPDACIQSSRRRRLTSRSPASDSALQAGLFDHGDGLGNLAAARAGLVAVEGRAAAPHALLVVEDLQTHVAALITRIEDETMRIDDRGRTEVLPVGPEHGARRGAGSAEDA